MDVKIPLQLFIALVEWHCLGKKSFEREDYIACSLHDKVCKMKRRDDWIASHISDDSNDYT